ncbi:Hypothetical_protein [Hexamita inflata]|uniref:Hypothetical_protein n=1 Tax=Hexamita inflata TaxID=28002 RepID=A0AA86UYL9_9EUKA|nr:Hypothetical protein HINF_LOCUS64890 [Hexamita inflata]
MEAHSPFNLNPVQFQLSAMPTIQSLRYAYSGPSSEILDVSEILRMIEDLNQNELLEFWNIMSQIHSCETKHIQEYCSTLQQSISQDSFGSDDVQKSRASKHMTEKVLKTKAIIKSALIQVIQEFGVRVNDFVSDRELCLLVNKSVEQDNTQQFWNKVANLVPSKTKKQIYDFYHASFSKALFDSQISKEDRKRIEQLNAENPNAKPAVLAQVFLDNTGKNVLKRNVIMCFINIRRYQSRQVK